MRSDKSENPQGTRRDNVTASERVKFRRNTSFPQAGKCPSFNFLRLGLRRNHSVVWYVHRPFEALISDCSLTFEPFPTLRFRGLHRRAPAASLCLWHRIYRYSDKAAVGSRFSPCFSFSGRSFSSCTNYLVWVDQSISHGLVIRRMAWVEGGTHKNARTHGPSSRAINNNRLLVARP